MNGEKHSFRWQWISISTVEGIQGSRQPWGVFSECAMTSGDRAEGRFGRTRNKFGWGRFYWRSLDLSLPKVVKNYTCKAPIPGHNQGKQVFANAGVCQQEDRLHAKRLREAGGRKGAFCPGDQCILHKLLHCLRLLGKVVFNLAAAVSLYTFPCRDLLPSHTICKHSHKPAFSLRWEFMFT